MQDRGVLRPSAARVAALAVLRPRFALLALIGCVLGTAPAVARSRSATPAPGGASAAELRPALPTASPLSGGSVGTHAGAPVSNPTWIRLSNGIAFDTAQPLPALDAAFTAGEAQPGPSYHIVQLRGPVSAAARAALERAGVQIVSYLPEYAFVVRADGDALARARALGEVRWTGAYQPAYKLSAAMNRKLAETEASSGEPLDLRVLFFPGEDMPAALAAVLGAGATVARSVDNGVNKMALVHASRALVPALAKLRSVSWIEPYAANVLHNATAQWITQTHVSNNRAIWDRGLHGEGQILSISDTGVRTTHAMFKDPAVSINATTSDYPTHRKLIGYRVMPGATFGDENSYLNTYHGTHTAGSLTGDDSYNNGISGYDGMAPSSKAYILDIGAGSAGSLYVPLDLNDMLIYPYQGNSAGHAFLTSQSWGLRKESLMQGVYEAEAMQIDQFMWAHKDFLVVQSAGNDGLATGTVEPPGTCKDCVTVGATDDISGASIPSYSSRGPTDDGRVKPTVVAPGDLVWSAYGSGDTSYHQLSGTSMATPIAASSCALIRQYLTEGWYPSGAKNAADAIANPSAALIKAMLVNSADQGGTWPDNSFGWGRIDVDSVLAFTGETRGLALLDYTSGLETGLGVDYTVNVASGGPLKVTLVWTDYPGNPSAATQLVNDLDLSVSGPSGTFLGNVIAGNQSVSGGTADHVNVEEWVRLNAPVAGAYTIHVGATNVPYGPQPFALVVTGVLDRTAAALSLDKPSYTAGNTIGIRLEDATPGLTAPVVSLTTSSGDQENVTLAAIGGGVFTGSKTIAPFVSSLAPLDGTLCVARGDVVTAVYNDASPAVTRFASAVIDAGAAVSSQVRVTGSTRTTATFAWNTSQGAYGHVEYGTTTALGSSSATEADLSGTHAVSVSGLAAGTTYYFDAVSVDGAGNVTRDDNGGRHYTFSTNNVPADVYLVLGDSSFPTDNLARYDAAFARAGWSYDYTYADVSGDPPLGNASSGLRSYPVVWWNTGLEQYPMMTDNQRTTYQQLHDGGARLALSSHDIAWDFGSTSGQDYNTTNFNFVSNTLHAAFKFDPDPVENVGGQVNDPISGGYVGGISYTQFRGGGAADEVAPNSGASGTAVANWTDDATPDMVGVRWQSSAPFGTQGSAAWGGQPTREAAMFFEFTQMDADSADGVRRAVVLDRTLNWLVGRERPMATLTSVQQANNTLTINWNAQADGGTSIASTTLQYSQDFGQTWTTIASGALSAPYNWDVTHVLNAPHTRIRLVLTDSGTPALHGVSSSWDFNLSHAGGDFYGPQAIAGTAVATPFPVRAGQTVTITATFSDTTSGFSTVNAAEYSTGSSAISAGSGAAAQATGGAFGTTTVQSVTATIVAGDTCSTCTAWLRAKDAAGNWGPAVAVPYVVRYSTSARGAGDEVSDGAPRFALQQNWPNPFASTTTLRFSLPAEGEAQVRVFASNGALVRTVLKQTLPAGPQSARWDGTDDAGRPVPAGVYFYRLDAGGHTQTRKLVRMN